jgi:hypothetical protein
MGELSTNLSADCDMATVLMAEGKFGFAKPVQGIYVPGLFSGASSFFVLVLVAAAL